MGLCGLCMESMYGIVGNPLNMDFGLAAGFKIALKLIPESVLD